MLSFEEVSEDSVGAFEVGNGAGDFEDGGHSCSCDSAGGLKSCSCSGCAGTRCRRTFSWMAVVAAGARIHTCHEHERGGILGRILGTADGYHPIL